jgi:hypothetical protein
MRVLGLLALLALAVGLTAYVLDDIRRRRTVRRLDAAPWRRTEYVDRDGVMHVVLRRSIREADGTEILADNDREIAAIPPGVPDFDDRLARARLEADLSCDRTNYRRQ